MQTKQSTRANLKFQDKVRTTSLLKKDKQRLLIGGTIIAIVIIISPYFFWLYEAFPVANSWDSPFGTLTSNYYGSFQVFIYQLFAKIVPLFLLLIWFFTCKHWWYHALIVPICTLAFQTYQIVNDEVRYIDPSEFYIIIPLIFIVAIFSYTVRTRIFDKIHGIDLSELSRVNWKGELKEEYNLEEDKGLYEDDDDDEMFMSY
jgi:hypothetical protein